MFVLIGLLDIASLCSMHNAVANIIERNAHAAVVGCACVRLGADVCPMVGRYRVDYGVIMCGGYTSSCYLLTSSGYQDMPGLINKRNYASSVVTPLGLWVTGKSGVILLLIV